MRRSSLLFLLALQCIGLRLHAMAEEPSAVDPGTSAKKDPLEIVVTGTRDVERDCDVALARVP